MPYSTRTLPDEPIIIQTFNPTYHIPTHIEESARALEAHLNAAGGPAFLILDVTRFVPHFPDMLAGLQRVTHGPDAILRHRHIRELVVAGTSGMARLAVEALNQAELNGLKAVQFNHLDDALAYVRANHCR